MIDINKIYCGNNLDIMKTMDTESIDLIYLDPPYFSQKNYGDFNDFWNSLDDYLTFMKLRLQEMHRILKDTGSIYLHVDWHAVHYLKVEMDKIFGYNNFQNEIIWCYKGGNATKKFRQKHDTILFYSKGKNKTFNVNDVRIPYNEILLNNTLKDNEGKLYYKTGQKGSKGKVYLHPNGQLLNDWWDDIPSATSAHGNEFKGYPTQKPEALLSRIIKVSSNPNDIIFDPFCGSGTTLEVANRLGRKYIGIDENKQAIEICKKRLKNNYNNW